MAKQIKDKVGSSLLAGTVPGRINLPSAGTRVEQPGGGCC